MLTDPEALLPGASQVRSVLADSGWSADALDDLLGATARTHLDRGELQPVLRRLREPSPLATLARLFVVGAPAPEAVALGVPEAWLHPDGTARTRLQPVRHGGLEVLVPHDPAGRTADQEHVIGVGAASLTLASATPRDVVGRTLDLGAGCGIQALLAEDHSTTVVATDRNPRAVSYARVAAALNGVALDARTGDLLEPVLGERFDLVVSNPPFVISPRTSWTYRDGGMPGDEVCRRIVRELPQHLADGGTAVLLANWLHVSGDDGDQRVQSWFEGLGCDTWVVERELAAPEDYVTAWLRDGDEDFAGYDAWLDALHGVEAIAFGVIAMRHGSGRFWHDAPDQPLAPVWGEQVSAHYAAQALLSGDLLGARLRLREDVRLQQVARQGPEGWAVEHQRLQQEAGLRWSGEVDAFGATLLAGCDGTRPLRDLLLVLALSAGLTEDEAAEQVVPVVRSLVAQGFLTG